MKTVIIIPTYNEKENIGLLLDSLQTVFKNIPHKMHILVVDDNSPDCTADVVRAEIKKWQNIHLLTGEKKGLGTAYTRGMRYAVDKLNADVVMEMDADFSHNPDDVPRMIAALEDDTDVVIGSRYVSGGSIPSN
jgi:dolichol-phosphate mannosyltransferase